MASYSVGDKIMVYLKQRKILDILRTAEISVDTDVIWVSFKKTENSLHIFESFLSKLENKNEVHISSMGETTVSILIPETLKKKAEEAFGSEIVDLDNRVGAIFIQCSKEVNKVAGVITYVSSMFTDKNVLIYDIIATYSDIAVIVSEEDAYKIAGHIKKVFGC